MFWKNAAWSWNDAAGNDDDDDGGYLLTADFRRTPDSTPDTDLSRVTTTAATTTNLSNSSTTTAGLKDLTNHRLTFSCPQSLNPIDANCRSGPANVDYSSCISTLCDGTNRCPATRNSSSTQRLTVSHTTQT